MQLESNMINAKHTKYVGSLINPFSGSTLPLMDKIICY